MKIINVASWSNILLRRVSLVERKCEYIVKTGGNLVKLIESKNCCHECLQLQTNSLQLGNFNPTRHCQVNGSFIFYFFDINYL